MGLLVDREVCRVLIEETLRKDHFFGTPDQLPRVNALRESLDADFRARLRETEQRVNRQKEDFDRALQSIRDFFDSNLQKIVQGFDNVKKSGESRELRHLSEIFRTSIAHLYHPVQYQLKPCLNKLSPESRVLPALLQEFDALYQRRAEEWPELVRLIYCKQTSSSLEGQSILEANLEVITEACCRSRLALVNFLRRIVLRQQYRFRYRILMVPLRQAYGDYFLAGGASRDPVLLKRWRETAAGLEAQLDDAWQAVRYGLEVASAELEVLADEPITEETRFLERIEEIEQIISDSLTRGREALGDIREPYHVFLDFLIERISHHHEAGLETLNADLRLMGSFRSLVYWNLKRLRKLQTRLLNRTRSFLFGIFSFLRRLAVKTYYEVEDQLSGLAAWIGISATERESLAALSELPRGEQIDARFASLPPIYRRLFSGEPLSNSEFLVGRNEELGLLREAVERWFEGRPSSVVIVGQVGTGKTSLVNCFLREVNTRIQFTVQPIERRLRSQQDVVDLFRKWFSIEEELADLSDLIRRIKALPKQGIIVELCHNLMLRTLGGRRAAEAFLYVLLSTRDEIFWLVTSREWPWALLNYQVTSRLFFTQEIRARFHDSKELKSAILVRHRSSGIKLVFVAEGVKDRKLRKLLITNDFRAEPVQTLLQEKYFDKLFEVTSGNMQAAIFFWLSSLELDRQSRMILVRPIAAPDLGLVRSLDPVSLYSLAELLNHGYLTDLEHSAIFQLALAQSRSTLDFLTNVRLVSRTESPAGMSYAVNPVLLGPICNVLKTMNILH